MRLWGKKRSSNSLLLVLTFSYTPADVEMLSEEDNCCSKEYCSGTHTVSTGINDMELW